MTTWISFGLLLAGPALHGLGACLSYRRAHWAVSAWLSLAALLSSISAAVITLSGETLALGTYYFLPASFSLLLAVMIALLGWVIIKFSANYLAGEPAAKVARYLQMLHFALSVVLLTVLTDHLAVFLVGWAAISFAVHELLLHYRQRRPALIAARKKFLVARLAEVLLLAAVFILVAVHDSWSVSEIMAVYPKALTPWENLAAVLIGLAALIKCAQIPAHGWLLQVVEAPTPVSALLHAGIVNLGGYLLIVSGALVTSSPVAQSIVVLVAGVTLVIASERMQRERTVKVKLAWSTCSQMALMLIEAALGFFEIALLHLFAHSLYKAHQFLRSGSAVEWATQAQLADQQPIPRLNRIIVSCLVAGSIAAVFMVVDSTIHLPSWILLGALVSVLLARSSRASVFARLLSGVAILGAFMFQRWLLSGVLDTQLLPTTPDSAVQLLADAVFALLWLGWAFDLKRTPAFAGLTNAADRMARRLDDRLTALTTVIWPGEPTSIVSHKSSQARTGALSPTETISS